MTDVGCEGPDGLLHVHPAGEWCDVCRPTGLTYERQGNHVVVGERHPLDPNANLDPTAGFVSFYERDLTWLDHAARALSFTRTPWANAAAFRAWIRSLRPTSVQDLTDSQHAAALDAAYGAIEGRGAAAGCTPEQIALAQVLFADGFDAALAAIA